MQNIGYETVIFQVFIMEEIRKVKYKVGQKFMVEMREGYHLSKIVRREIEICRIDKTHKLYDEGMIESEHRGFPRAFRISQKGLLSLNP